MNHFFKLSFNRWRFLARLAAWQPPPDPPQPPPSRVPHPKPHGPGGRRDAIAVAEPEPDLFVDARASSARR